MKKKLFLSFFLFACTFTFSQTYVPDDNFEQALIDMGLDDVLDNYVNSENIKPITYLSIQNKNISDATGIEGFESLYRLYINDNKISDLNLNNNTSLQYLTCGNNELISLSINQCVALKELNCRNNNLSTLELSNLSTLEVLNCEYNEITSLDLSSTNYLKQINCRVNNLTSLNIKSGKNYLISEFNTTYNPDLLCIQVDDVSYSELNWTNIDNQTRFNLNCSADDDDDSVNNETDICQNTPHGESVGIHGCGSSEKTYIPDNNFEQALIDYGYDDILDNYVITLKINKIEIIDIGYRNISDLTGLEAFENLYELLCYGNNLTTLNLNSNPKLGFIWCNDNGMTNLIIDQLKDLVELMCYNNQFTSLDVSQNTSLVQLECNDNLLTSLILNQNISYLSCANNNLTDLNFDGISSLVSIGCENNELTSIDISEQRSNFDLYCGNNKLTSLNLKNGSIYGEYVFDNNPDLEFICVDETELVSIQNKVNTYGYTNCVVNSYCTFTPGGVYYTFNGKVKYDSNSDGCDISDLAFSNLKFNVSDGVTTGEFISNSSGEYEIPLQEGIHTITPKLENPTYFTISPTSIVVDFPTDSSPKIQDFCITPISGLNDLEISIIPILASRPGFDAKYKIIYKNKGSTTLSGSVDFSFNDDIIDFVSASPTEDNSSTNLLSWNYEDLLSFESREIEVVLNINSPVESPAVNNGDVLTYSATINPVAGDQTEDDNLFALNQTVVNSYDPNDKTCLEGNTITPDLIGEFVHYLIRCENTGTAEAVNIVIKDEIDITKFDISTLSITDSSHDMVTEIDGSTVEFIFENINLPFDDANNDGYVAFKIKTQVTLSVGESFENDAEIYFDYNAAIITNTVSTNIQNALGLNDFKNSIGDFKMYPNPTKENVFIETKENIKSFTVYNNLGKLIQHTSIVGNKKQTYISTQNLSSGIYFVKIETNNGPMYSKLIKE